MVAPQPRGGEISNFRHLLGLDSGQQHKPRTMKDSKEIMKKRRERAICVVSCQVTQCPASAVPGEGPN